ncbi:hypothetical protein TNCV_2367991 [Trichonephila clavipes]|nr:hypothetical protein TNCV_2367991 [Trichonephila clavipes]
MSLLQSSLDCRAKHVCHSPPPRFSFASCLKRIKARGALNTFHSSWTQLMPSLSTFLPVVPMTLPDKPDALEYAARQGQVQAGILYQEPNAKRVFALFCKDYLHKKRRGWTISNGPSWRKNIRMNLDPMTCCGKKHRKAC